MNATTREPAEILLVDEDPLALAATTTALDSAGYVVYQAMDRIAALRIARSRDEFLALIQDALNNDDQEKAAARQAAVRDGTWDARAEWVSGHIEALLDKNE